MPTHMSELHRPTFAILASHSGTTAEAVIHATQSGVLDAEVGLVISNNKNAGVFERTKRLNKQHGLDIRMKHVTRPEGTGTPGVQTPQESETIWKAIQREGIKNVVLLGYLRKVVGALLEEPDTIVNSHPGPLPETKGLHSENVQKRVLELGLEYSAQILHDVDEEYDHGKIRKVNIVPVMPGETFDTLTAAVQATEKAFVPVDLNDVLNP